MPEASIFSSDFDYEIPSYRRPYAWTGEESGELFDDLCDFYCAKATDEQYFLGSIVLVKEEDKPRSEVIDGQQRLTTLTILLSAMASKLDSPYKEAYTKYIIEPGNVFEGLDPKPRVHIRKSDSDFFKKYIQGMQSGELLQLEPDTQDTEAKGNIIRNAKLLLNRIDDKFSSQDEIVKFGAYVCLWDPAFAAYLDKKRAEGKHYNVALSHAAKKLVRLIYDMEKSRKPYNAAA